MNRHSVIGSIAVWLMLPLFVTVLQAQAHDVDPDTIAPVRLDPVVVTALRIPLELTEVPYAVSVNYKSEIQRARPGLGLDEALRGIPGVQVDNRYNYALGERISIRGFGARAQFGVRGVEVLLDGVPATLPDGQTTLNHIDLATIGRAEVIRGPASALYGNAAGGVIQLSTEAPPPIPLGQQIEVTAGENGLMRVHGALGGQNGRTSYQLSATDLRYRGFRDFNEARNLYANGRVAYQGDRDRVHLVLSAVDYHAQNPGSLSDSLLREDRSQAYSRNMTQRTGEDGRQAHFGLGWQRAMQGGELELAGYALSRSIDNPIPPEIIGLERIAGGIRAQFSARSRLASQEVRWTVGAETGMQRDDRQNFTNEEGERGALTLDQRERVLNFGAFAQLVADIGPRVKLLGAVRYDLVRFRADDHLLGDGNPDDSGSRAMDAFSPSAGISYTLGEAANLYANVATSFETPTTTELVNRPGPAGGFNPALEPQRATSFEVGGKGRMGATAIYQLALYRAHVEDALIPFEIPEMQGRQFFRNAGSAVHQGVEASATINPGPHWRARAGYTYTDARFDDYAVGDVVHDGNRIPGVAPHRLEIALTHESPAGWFAGIESRYASDTPVNDDNSDFSPAYMVADIRAGFESVQVGQVELAPFVGITNVFDETYNTSVVVNAFGGRYYEPGPGRSLYAGATLTFGWIQEHQEGTLASPDQAGKDPAQ